MEKLVQVKHSSHWYYPNAEPCYEVQSADGKKMVKTTVTHARKLGLLPSVTTILGLLAKPELDAWKQEQLLMASLTLTRLEGESDVEFVKRIIEDSEAYSGQAMEFGNKVHAYIEYLFSKPNDDGEVFVPQISESYQKMIAEFIYTNNISGSCEILCADGVVGGKVDFFGTFRGEPAIIDWKTQGTKGKGFNWYDNWLLQLVGYARLMKQDPEKIQLVNIAVSSKEELIDCYVWKSEEIRDAVQVFDRLVDIFYILKKLPRQAKEV